MIQFQFDSSLKNCSSSENVINFPEKDEGKESIRMDIIANSEEKVWHFISTIHRIALNCFPYFWQRHERPNCSMTTNYLFYLLE